VHGYDEIGFYPKAWWCKRHPANITHHFRKLQETELIELVEERDTGRVVEKYYRAIARTFQIRDENLSMEGVGRRALYLLQEDMRAAMIDLPVDATNLICLIASAPLSKKNFSRFQKNWKKL
jgi:DNA-binding transcriptional ArsR family regulator